MRKSFVDSVPICCLSCGPNSGYMASTAWKSWRNKGQKQEDVFPVLFQALAEDTEQFPALLALNPDNLNNLTETFSYDNLDRLKVAAGNVTLYDNKGNVTKQTDAGTFVYGLTNKPYAISGVTNPSSLIAQGNQDITFTSFSRPDSIVENGYTAAFTYNSDGERVRMVLSQNGNVVSTKYYLGDCYERICTGSNVKERVYMFGNYYNATSVNQREGSSDNIFYLIRDYQGSVTNVIIAGGYQIQNVRYDAWGRLRNPYTGVLYTASNMPEIHFRGYTGH